MLIIIITGVWKWIYHLKVGSICPWITCWLVKYKSGCISFSTFSICDNMFWLSPYSANNTVIISHLPFTNQDFLLYYKQPQSIYLCYDCWHLSLWPSPLLPLLLAVSSGLWHPIPAGSGSSAAHTFRACFPGLWIHFYSMHVQEGGLCGIFRVCSQQSILTNQMSLFPEPGSAPNTN